MVVLGVDAHKRNHTVVCVDSNGKQQATICVEATTSGHSDLIEWSKQFAERMWAIEDCRSLSRRLEGDLLAAGESGVRVPPSLMALHRRSVRSRGKSDPIDALAVAQAALREVSLPVISPDGVERELRLLVDYRDGLVCQRTAQINRLHLHLHELDPTQVFARAALGRTKTLRSLLKSFPLDHCVIGDIARQVAVSILSLNDDIAAINTKIKQRTQVLAPSLLELHGCADIAAATLLGEIAGVSRFRSKDAFASFNGTAPIPVWSANKTHYRLNRCGNRQVNAVIHRIAITQMTSYPPAKTYVANQLARGKTKKGAIRCLKRKISNEVFCRMLADERLRSFQELPPQEAAA